MIANQLALIRREIWEHRSIWVTPAAIATIMTLMMLAAQIFASGSREAVDVAILGASNAGEAPRKAALTAYFVGISSLFVFAMGILTVFYCLDALYAERKDKSILFWRSLPVTDAETVVSKLLTAAIVIPLATFVGIAITHLINLLITSAWVSSEGGKATMLIWGSAPIFDNWAAMLILLLLLPLWMSPFIGWFLLVSAYAKRMPLLLSFMPLIVLPLLERVIFKTSILAEVISFRWVNIPILRIDFEDFFDEDNIHASVEQAGSLLTYIDIGKFLSSPAMWGGLVVCGLLSTAAIYIRRYKDDS